MTLPESKGWRFWVSVILLTPIALYIQWRDKGVPQELRKSQLRANDNVDEDALGKAYLACPCHCASKDDLRVAIAAYEAAKAEREKSTTDSRSPY